jgi:LEA14-like dessication related protein
MILNRYRVVLSWLAKQGAGAVRLSLQSVAVLVLGACAVLPPLTLKAPELVVSEIEIADIGLNQIVFVVHVAASNPNDIEIPLTNVRFDLDLLNGPFARGAVRQELLSLPARSSRNVPVEFSVPTVRVVQLIRSFKTVEWSRLAYQLRGSATWGPNGIALPFERSGDLNAVKQLVELFAR